MSSEGGRIAQVLMNSRACMANVALAKARALYGSGGGGGGSCSSGCSQQSQEQGPEVPQSSTLLNNQVQKCLKSGYISPYTCVPESIRTQQASRTAVECYVANGPYERVFPAPCPPIVFDPYYYDASGNRVGLHSLGTNTSGQEPILQGKVCPLPNKPYNPVLPG
jgi:hypothetical protein